MPQAQQTLAQMVRAKYPGAYDDLSDQDLEKSVKTKYPGIYDDLSNTKITGQTTNKPLVFQAAETAGRAISDVAIGGVKRVGSAVLSVSELINKALGTGPDKEVWDRARQDFTTPTTTAQKVGGVAADIGMAMVPSGHVTRAAQVVSRLVPRGTQILTRAAVEGAGQAAIAGAQGSDPTLAGVVGGVAGGASGAIRATRGAMVNPNVVEREALEYAASKGVPVDAATMSGNAGLKGAKYLADKSLAGSLVAGKELQKESKGLATLGEQLSAKTGQAAQTPLSAGEAIQGALEKRIKDLHAEASQHYDALRQLEAANIQRVITGSGPSKTGVVRAVTQTEPMGFPVQLKPVKAALKPLYDRLQRQMPVTQRQASAGFQALENIVNGPDISPASLVDADLSAIKSIARGADQSELRDLSQGLAARAVSQLDSAVQRAVAQGGPAATKALQEGRKATRAKYLTAEIRDSLRQEPVKAFKQATERGDASIAKLRELQTVATAEIPKLGRAYLDDALEKATNEGGFKGAVRLANEWQALGPQTKAMLFPTTGLTSELDKFFLAAKRLAENPNPSGTSGVVSLGTQGGLLVLDPALGVGAQITGAALSKLLRNQTAVRLLTQGMKAPKNSMTAQALKQAVIRVLSPSRDAGKEPE